LWTQLLFNNYVLYLIMVLSCIYLVHFFQIQDLPKSVYSFTPLLGILILPIGIRAELLLI
jgi:hypothetical protein